MKERPNNAEDKLFKATFSRPQITEELLRKMASPELKQALRLETLALSNTSYVDGDLTEHFADLVFNCQSNDNGTAQVALLLEHKSFMPAFPPLQIIGYQVNGWKQQVKAKSKPTPIIPIIFYHGKEAWKQQSWMTYLSSRHSAFETFTPHGNYLLIDLSNLSDEAIFQFRYGFMKTVLLLMKHRFERNFLLENLTYILNFVEEEGELSLRMEDFHTILRYLTASISLKWAEVIERVGSLSKTNQAMTILEEFKQDFKEEGLREGRELGVREGLERGVKEGRERGVKEGLELGISQKTEEVVISLIENFPKESDTKLAQIAKVEEAYVRQLRQAMKKSKKE